MAIDCTGKQWMARALALARLGLGGVQANPLVGAVVVRQDKIVSEGYHALWGHAHAERMALARAMEQHLDLNDATLYVTLEPCCHQGKTPPCTDIVLQSGIQRVVVGSLDPNPLMQGKGIALLRKQGLTVETRCLEEECKALNRAFFTNQRQHCAYIVLKWAQSSDGYLDSPRPASAPAPWLTNEHCRLIVHRWRSELEAIYVGANTILRDNPRLDARCWNGHKPIRVTYDQDLSLPRDRHFFDGTVRTILYTSPTAVASRKASQFQRIEGLELAIAPEGPLFYTYLAHNLYTRGISSLLVEGGRQTLEGFLTSNCYNELRVFVGSHPLGSVLAAPQVDLSSAMRYTIDDSLLFIQQHDC